MLQSKFISKFVLSFKKINLYLLIIHSWGVSAVKESVCSGGTETWVRSLSQEDPLEKEIGNPLQYSCLEKSHGQRIWWATVYGVAKEWTPLSD